MKKLLLSLLLLFFIRHLNAQTNKFFITKGKEIISPEGKPFLIKGTNLGNWLVPEGYMFKFKNTSSPRLINQLFNELIGPSETKKFWKQYLASYITEEDIIYLKSTGMNSIPLPFHYKLFTKEDYLGRNDEEHGFQLFDKLISWCKKANLYILLDMHCAPGGQTGDNIDDSFGYPFLFESEESQRLTIDIWKSIATRYKNESIILGYDLLNEPIPHFFDTAHFNPKLEPLYKRITQAIRTVDKNHLIFLGGAQWNSNFKPFGPPFDNKLVYTFHKYWTDTIQQVIQEYVDYRDRYNVPIYVGETGENSDAWVAAFRKLCEKNDIGWHFWPYKKMDSQSGIVRFDKPKYFDAIITYADSTKKNFEEIRNLHPTNKEASKKSIDQILINCLFKNCIENQGYIKSLGLASKNQAHP